MARSPVVYDQGRFEDVETRRALSVIRASGLLDWAAPAYMFLARKHRRRHRWRVDNSAWRRSLQTETRVHHIFAICRDSKDTSLRRGQKLR
jgi:hypothetical protein